MKKNKKHLQLQFGRETVRKLAASELRTINGGVNFVIESECDASAIHHCWPDPP